MGTKLSKFRRYCSLQGGDVGDEVNKFALKLWSGVTEAITLSPIVS